MGFADNACTAYADRVHACAGHPTLTAIARDEFPRSKFLTYLEQDIYYLNQEARVLSIAASRAPSISTLGRMAEQAREFNANECERYVRLTEHLGRRVEPDTVSPLPAVYGYTAHLRSVALEGTALEILMALLPCTYLYRYFALTTSEPGPRDPVYTIWFSAFQSEDYARWLSTQKDLIDTVAETEPPARRSAARAAFGVSLHYEHAVNDAILKGQDWLPQPAAP